MNKLKMFQPEEKRKGLKTFETLVFIGVGTTGFEPVTLCL